MSKTLNYKSCFDVIGPAMVGPSSSHTAGTIEVRHYEVDGFVVNPTGSLPM